MTPIENTAYDPRRFATTRWSLVIAAGNRSSAESADALESLCRTYWYPLYVYARRRIPNIQQAQDVTQAFIARILEQNLIDAADPTRGRFRGFLLTVFKRFLVNEWEKEKAAKRGGGTRTLSIDFELGESKYSQVPTDEVTAERLYERQWALTMLENVIALLQEEYLGSDKAEYFECLKQFIAGANTSTSYAEAATTLGISEGAAKVAAHRLRQRYRELLRSEITQTVADPSEVDDEIRNLFDVLGS